MQQDYVLQDGDFRKIANLVMEKTGIVLSEKKRAFIHGRLGRRLRILGLEDFSQYCRLLESRAGEDERHMLINAVTTNHTSFFREEHHFDYLTKTVLPTIAAPYGNKPGRLRIWSAGCSTGEEPHTLAMMLREFRPSLADWDAKILATDLDTNVVSHAATGLYDADRLETIPAAYRKRYVTVEDDGRFRINDEVRSLISFAPLNLLEKWPMSGPFDVIFCRNVVIYFDKPTQRTLFDRYAELLRPDGWLFIGHSESLLNVTNRFSLVGRTIYRRTS
ncbi:MULTISPECIES: protein-glutamate O-methyltransferase [Rhodopseudomonas]|uniref:Chemotaxis protein methyltransferase n=1 Tax=Rhodopseudomonas palustris TaxID=1076 RepID=A0A0D7F423_RHOPL|nr:MULTISPECIES: protein-glutamate O-methyltransferase [Rhodopseudomonas]KIZ47555.1 chemotaxis protein CheR [Rhodopseudomonas palustris]MDF3809601.1 protein-glutamate O-methyltransferase [Rhodopseudomonas sp. BAL398]WOK17796.1 protein-glutamate O-methyltransferase [Rhodopseudomonas sp. BAL398]